MRRGDLLVLVLAASVVIGLFDRYWGDNRVGEQARILVGDRQLALVSLAGHRRIEVDGALGPSVLEVEEGRIRFVDSPCQGKLCVHNGWVTRGGEVVACLPNRVSVAVLGGEQRFDAVNF